MRSMLTQGAATDAEGGPPAAQQPAQPPGEAPAPQGEAPKQPGEAPKPKQPVDIEALDESAGGCDD